MAVRMVWGAVLCGVVSVVLLAGCGVNSHQPERHTVGLTQSATPAQPPAGILGRVLTDNEMRGFVGQPNGVDDETSSWLADLAMPTSERPAWAAWLNDHGFMRGVIEGLANQAGDAGGSRVMQFESDDGALDDLTAEESADRTAARRDGEHYIVFPVPSIPGAVGQGIVLGPHNGEISILFTTGPYYYVLNRDIATSLPASIASLSSAAQHLYHRVSSENNTASHGDQAGYVLYELKPARGLSHGQVHSVQGSWSVPSIIPHSGLGESSTWIGAQAPGPSGHAPFVQVGLLETRYKTTVATRGGVRTRDVNQYITFWSDTAHAFQPITLFRVHPGDALSAQLTSTSQGWRVSITDRTSHRTRSASTHDESDRGFNEAEWLQEATEFNLYPRLSRVRFRDIEVNSAPPSGQSPPAAVESRFMSTGKLIFAPGSLNSESFSITSAPSR